jgi:hypothetical protein
MQTNEIEETVSRLRDAFINRRLRAEAEFVSIKDLASVVRRFGGKANMKMPRQLLVGEIERSFISESRD